MNRAEFMRELTGLLQNVPESERIEALKYYDEYFNDAGEENEGQVIDELESPQRVAEKIKDGLRADMDSRDPLQTGSSQTWQSGGAYRNGTSYQGSTVYQNNTFYQGNGTAVPEQKFPAWAIVLIVLACIVGSPAILASAGTLLGAVISVFFGFFGLIIGFGAAGIGLIVAGICIIVASVMGLFAVPYAGLTLMGIGFLLIALGILFLMLTVWLCGWAAPALFKGIQKLWNLAAAKVHQWLGKE